ncbi:MAG: PCI domain-containing protein [Promethearchaeia archaeon]
MADKNTEDIFNELMESSGDSDQKQEDLEETDQKRCVTEFNFDGDESVDDLVDKFGPRIKQEIMKLQRKGHLEEFLKENLESFFNRIRGAWEQFSDDQINMKQFILAGTTVLRKKFIKLFIASSDKKEQEISSSGPSGKSSEEVKRAERKSVKKTEPETTSKGVSIPSALLGGGTQSNKSGTTKETQSKVEKKGKSEPEPKKVQKPKISAPKNLKIEGVSDKKSLSISPESKPRASKKKKTLEKPKKPSKIESLAPEKKTRTRMESIKNIAEELDKPTISNMNYEKLDQHELKSVNLGSSVPGSPLYDEIQRIKNLIYEEKFDHATRELEKLKNYAQNKKQFQSALEKLEDIATNMGVYRSIPVLIKSGDEMLDQPEKALKKYEKAEKFAKTIGDTHYIDLISDKISKANERVIFLEKKKRIQKEETDKLKELIKMNVKRLCKEETLISVEEIRKYCNVPSKQIDFVEEVIIEMIKNKEVYGKYFTSSQKVMFDKENNREFLV